MSNPLPRTPSRGAIIMVHDGTPFYQEGLTAIMATQGPGTRFGAVFKAVRDHGVVLAMLPPSGHPFELPEGKPVIALADDLASGTFGPGAFHRASLRRALRMADNIAVHSCQGAEPYVAAAAAAAAGEHVFIVDTRPEQERYWIETIKALAPGREVLLICEKPHGGLQ